MLDHRCGWEKLQEFVKIRRKTIIQHREDKVWYSRSTFSFGRIYYSYVELTADNLMPSTEGFVRSPVILITISSISNIGKEFHKPEHLYIAFSAMHIKIELMTNLQPVVFYKLNAVNPF